MFTLQLVCIRIRVVINVIIYKGHLLVNFIYKITALCFIQLRFYVHYAVNIYQSKWENLTFWQYINMSHYLITKAPFCVTSALIFCVNSVYISSLYRCIASFVY